MQYSVPREPPVGGWTGSQLTPRLGSQKAPGCVCSVSVSFKQTNKSSFSCSYCLRSLIFVMTSLFFAKQKYYWMVFQSRSNPSYTPGVYSLISMMHSLLVIFFVPFLLFPSLDILNNSCDLEVFNQIFSPDFCFSRSLIISSTLRAVFTVLCFRPKMLCKTKTLWWKSWFQWQCLEGFAF